MDRQELIDESTEMLDACMEELEDVPLEEYAPLSMELVRSLFRLHLYTGEERYATFLPTVLYPEQAGSILVGALHNVACKRIEALIHGTSEDEDQPEPAVLALVYGEFHMLVYECSRVHASIRSSIPSALRMWIEAYLADRRQLLERLAPIVREQFSSPPCFDILKERFELAMIATPKEFWWAE